MLLGGFMFTLSAFADEIDPNPQTQIDVLRQCGVRHIELRSILKTNVLDLTDLQIQELKSLLDRHGITLSAIGSPIGKIKIDEPFAPHLQRFRRAVAVAGLPCLLRQGDTGDGDMIPCLQGLQAAADLCNRGSDRLA